MILFVQNVYHRLKYFLIPSKIFASTLSAPCLEINVEKGEILSTRDIAFFKTVSITKTIVLKFFIDKPETYLISLKHNWPNIHTSFFDRKLWKPRNKSLKALMFKDSSTVHNKLVTKRILEVKFFTIRLQWAVSLPHITSKIISAKLIDEINSSDENDNTFSKDLSVLSKSLTLRVSKLRMV